MPGDRDIRHFALQLRELGGDLGDIPKELSRELRPQMRKTAQPILNRARRNASWSTRIPKATRIQTSLSTRHPGVAIAVSGKKAPHAPLYENKGKPGSFRHPLFGDRSHWYTQAARPFLRPAVDAYEDKVVADVDDVVDRVAHKYGFR